MANFKISDQAHTDPCLEDAYLSYKKEIFDPDKEDRIKDRSLNGDNYYPEDYQVDATDWLFIEAKLAVYNITQQIRNDIHLGPDINYQNYPNPADAMRATAHDLTARIEANQRLRYIRYWLINRTRSIYSYALALAMRSGVKNLLNTARRYDIEGISSH